MNRKDCTGNTEDTFEALAAQLRCHGFDVDHFHAVEVIEGEEFVTHFAEFGGKWENDRQFKNVSPMGWDMLVADEWHE